MRVTLDALLCLPHNLKYYTCFSGFIISQMRGIYRKPLHATRYSFWILAIHRKLGTIAIRCSKWNSLQLNSSLTQSSIWRL